MYTKECKFLCFNVVGGTLDAGRSFQKILFNIIDSISSPYAQIIFYIMTCMYLFTYVINKGLNPLIQKLLFNLNFLHWQILTPMQFLL